MSARIKGTILVDFAGTFAEAAAYAKEHDVKAARNTTARGDEGLPMLSKSFTTLQEGTEASRKFMELGWDEGAQIVHMYGRVKPSVQPHEVFDGIAAGEYIENGEKKVA